MPGLALDEPIDREGDGWRNASWAIVDATTRAVAASDSAAAPTEVGAILERPGAKAERVEVRAGTGRGWRSVLRD